MTAAPLALANCTVTAPTEEAPPQTRTAFLAAVADVVGGGRFKLPLEKRPAAAVELGMC